MVLKIVLYISSILNGSVPKTEAASPCLNRSSVPLSQKVYKNNSPPGVLSVIIFTGDGSFLFFVVYYIFAKAVFDRKSISLYLVHRIKGIGIAVKKDRKLVPFHGESEGHLCAGGIIVACAVFIKCVDK